MNENKTVMVNGQTFKMCRVPRTGWIFIAEEAGRRWVAKIVGDEVAAIDQEPAISDVTNEELANAWIEAGK